MNVLTVSVCSQFQLGASTHASRVGSSLLTVTSHCSYVRLAAREPRVRRVTQ